MHRRQSSELVSKPTAPLGDLTESAGNPCNSWRMDLESKFELKFTATFNCTQNRRDLVKQNLAGYKTLSERERGIVCIGQLCVQVKEFDKKQRSSPEGER